MTDQPQPEVRWAPHTPPPKRRGRVWLIVALAVAAIAIVASLLFVVLPRGDEARPTPTPTRSTTPTATPSASPTPTATPTPTPTPTATPTPSPSASQTPISSAPPVTEPDVGTFRGQVQPWLDDALTGLEIAAHSSGQDAVSVVDTLQEDAQRLWDAPPPASISQQWRDAVTAYTVKLDELRSAATAGSNLAGAIDGARAAVNDLRALVGL